MTPAHHPRWCQRSDPDHPPAKEPEYVPLPPFPPVSQNIDQTQNISNTGGTVNATQNAAQSVQLNFRRWGWGWGW